MQRRSYPSDLSEQEWAILEPLTPPAKPGGHPRTTDMREVINAILYLDRTGCQWRAIPRDLPPRSTVHDFLDLWSWDGTLDRIHYALYIECREESECEAEPACRHPSAGRVLASVFIYRS